MGKKKEGEKKNQPQTTKRSKSFAALQIMTSYTQDFKTISLESSNVLAVVSKAASGSQVTGSQENSAIAAHLLLLSFLEITLTLKTCEILPHTHLQPFILMKCSHVRTSMFYTPCTEVNF